MNNDLENIWLVYMIRCSDNSLYTGIIKYIKRRYKEHFEGKGAKYTRMRPPKEICCIFKVENRSLAGKLEYFIKKLSKKEKEFLIFEEKNKKDFIKIVKQKLKIEIFL